jgi:hypothetical protein
VLRHFRNSDNKKKELTRRANQAYINIVARTDKARAEKSAAGFLSKYSNRTAAICTKYPEVIGVS